MASVIRMSVSCSWLIRPYLPPVMVSQLGKVVLEVISYLAIVALLVSCSLNVRLIYLTLYPLSSPYVSSGVFHSRSIVIL